VSALRRSLIVALGTLLGVLPRVASACAVCFSGKEDDSRVAFIATTAFMTAMPLLLVGGTIYYLYRRSERISAEAVAEREQWARVRDLNDRADSSATIANS
jgi:hypothetical protein